MLRGRVRNLLGLGVGSFKRETGKSLRDISVLLERVVVY